MSDRTFDPVELQVIAMERLAKSEAECERLQGLLDNERLYTAEHQGYAQVVGKENAELRRENSYLMERNEWLYGHENHLQSQLDAAWSVLDWLAENNPAALELCPYKVTR